MQIIQLTRQSAAPYKGDLVLIQNQDCVEAYRVAEVKITHEERREIILRKRDNIWFDWGKYLDGESWVKDCRVVLP